MQGTIGQVGQEAGSKKSESEPHGWEELLDTRLRHLELGLKSPKFLRT